MYNKPPKEAADDYLHGARQQLLSPQQASRASQRERLTSSSPPKSDRLYPYGFNANAPTTDPNKTDSKIEYDSAYTELAKKLYDQKVNQSQSGREIQFNKSQRTTTYCCRPMQLVR